MSAPPRDWTTQTYSSPQMKETKTCCLCDTKYVGYGNNPAPFQHKEGEQCCDKCNATKVIPYRIALMNRKTCCLCDIKYVGYGNNPAPFQHKEGEQCCDKCNATKVVPYRIALMNRKHTR